MYVDSFLGMLDIPVKILPAVSPILYIRKVQTGTNHFSVNPSFSDPDLTAAVTPGKTDRVT